MGSNVDRQTREQQLVNASHVSEAWKLFLGAAISEGGQRVVLFSASLECRTKMGRERKKSKKKKTGGAKKKATTLGSRQTSGDGKTDRTAVDDCEASSDEDISIAKRNLPEKELESDEDNASDELPDTGHRPRQTTQDFHRAQSVNEPTTNKSLAGNHSVSQAKIAGGVGHGFPSLKSREIRYKRYVSQFALVAW